MAPIDYRNAANMTKAQLRELSTAELLELFNTATGKATKKFASREKGVDQTFRALEKLRAEARANPLKPGRRLGLTFRLAPLPEGVREPRAGSAREKAFEVLRGRNGGTFREVMEATGWSRKKAYEGIRLLNLHNGYGLFSEELEGDDYRIWIVTRAEFDRRTEREPAAAA